MVKLERVSSPWGFMSSNVLKIIACVSMFVDHLGLVIFPTDFGFRMIGRLAFPLFAFFIAEGCHYTKRKARRFWLLFGSGIFYLIFFRFMSGTFYASIFLTFSASVIIIYSLDYMKKCIFSERGICERVFSVALCAGLIFGFYMLEKYVEFDYGFVGMMIPVLVSLFDFRDLSVPAFLRALDTYYVRIIMLTLGIIALFLTYSGVYVYIFSVKVSIYWAYFAVPVLLLFYNGKVGKIKMKYFFYIFYPVHLVVIYGLGMLIFMF